MHAAIKRNLIALEKSVVWSSGTSTLSGKVTFHLLLAQRARAQAIYLSIKIIVSVNEDKHTTAASKQNLSTA